MSWQPVEDGFIYHHTDKIPAEWNYPAHIESIEFLEVRDNGTVIACGSMPKEDEHEANLPDGYALCRQVPDAASAPTFAFNWDIIPADYEWAAVERYMLEQWQVHAHFYEPQWDKNLGWISDGDCEHIYIVDDLPLGLDYRTLKEQRPAEMKSEATDDD